MIEIKLAVTLEQLIDIGKLLSSNATLPESHTEPTAAIPQPLNKVVAGDVRPSHVKPVVTSSPGIISKSVKAKANMPRFGRTAAQVEAFNEEEQTKFNKKSEEDLLKEERKQEREAAKAIKQEALDDKAKEKKRQEDEVAEIKKATKTTEIQTPALVQPWKMHQL